MYISVIMLRRVNKFVMCLCPVLVLSLFSLCVQYFSLWVGYFYVCEYCNNFWGGMFDCSEKCVNLRLEWGLTSSDI